MNKQDIEDIYELSPMQQGMFFHSLAAPESGAYSNRISYILKGDLNVPAFERAWQEVVDRHPVFRTSFHSEDFDKLLQVVHKQAKLPMELQDLREFTQAEQDERLDDYLKEEGRRGFNLTEAPLMRLALFQCADDTYQFVMSQHHMVMDGWCRPLVFKEAFAFYEAFRRGESIQLELPRPYRHYIIWLQQQDMAGAEAFWRDELKGFLSPAPLVVDRIPSYLPTKEDDYDKQSIQLSRATTDAIKALARQHSLTLNTMIQGLWSLMLSHYGGEEDVVFGATVSGRPADLRGVESMIGLFINTLPVRVRVRPEAQLLDWLKDIQAHQVQVRQYEYSPLMDVQQWSEVPRTLPLFDSILVFENFPEGAEEEAGGSLEMRMDRFFDWTNYPLTVEVVPSSELLFLILYDRRLFDDATVTRMLTHLKTLLEGAVANPQSRLSELPLLTEPEREQLLVEWNLTRADYPRNKCLQELFEVQVERSPEAIAVVCEDRQMTYRQLNDRSNQLANFLRELGVGPDHLVALCMDRTSDMLVALLGILKAGGAYVPIDPTYPAQRISFMLEDSRASIILTQQRLLEVLPQHQAHMVCLDIDWSQIAEHSDRAPTGVTRPENLAYMIYTSGTTGEPKGVQIEHRNVVNFLSAMGRSPGLTSDDTLLAVTTISFDIHVLEIFLPLTVGAKVIVASREAAMDAKQLYDLLLENNVTAMQATPATWRLLLDSAWHDPLPLKVLCGGESLSSELATDLLPKCATLWNMYGPTESTVWSSVEQITSTGGTITVGHPIDNTQFYIVDSHSQPVPIGVPGELLISGDGVSRGYLNRSELNAERFIVNPFSNNADTRLFRTGDRARYLPDGRIAIIGRLDHQIKLRGYRIEAGEIEKSLEGHDAVKQAIVILREDQPGDQRLVAYLLGNEVNVAVLREWLKQSLPDYMVPSAYVWLQEFPVTPNNKVNRKILPAPKQNSSVQDEHYIAPQSEIEKLLVDIFQDVLQIDGIGCYDNFFDLGGHSLLSIKVVARFEQATGIHMHPGEMFQQTIGQIAGSYEKKLFEKQNSSKKVGMINTIKNIFN